MLGYYKSVWFAAWAQIKARFRGGRRAVIQFFLQTGVFLALLFFMPWLGQVQAEARLVLAGVGGMLASALLLFVIELVKAPARLAAEDRGEVLRLGGALRFNENAESIRAQGYAIYEDWRRALPKNPNTHDANWGDVSQVEARAEQFIAANFDDRCLMSYRYGMGYHVQDEQAGTPAYFKRRFDAFHSILLSHSTKAELLASQFKPENWKAK